MRCSPTSDWDRSEQAVPAAQSPRGAQPQVESPSMIELTNLTAEALSAGLGTRQFSCRELMQATLDHIERVNPRCNAIVSMRDSDTLLREADERDADLRRGERRGWLHGLPQAIKDMAATA